MIRFASLVLLASLVFSATAQADGFGDWNNSFTWENDKPFESDRFYTNGLRYTLSLPRDEAPDWAARVFDALDGTVFPDWPPPDGDTHDHVGFGFRHILFTPSQPGISGANLNDHPYDAWFGLSAFRHRDTRLQDDPLFEALRITFGFGLGVVGSGAGGKFIQNNYHDLIGADQLPWDVQSRTEPTLAYSFSGAWRTHPVCVTTILCADVIGRGGVTAGSPQTTMNTGVQVRFGLHLPRTFGTDVIDLTATSSVPDSAFESRQSRTGDIPFGLHMFAGLEGRYTPFDVFLDGTLFRAERPGTTRPRPEWIRDAYVGASFDVWRLSLVVMFTERTKTFDAQRANHRFGSFQARWLQKF